MEKAGCKAGFFVFIPFWSNFSKVFAGVVVRMARASLLVIGIARYRSFAF
ncbi:hypothetical protein K3G39_18495 [Pontibacter sp. HSC-14F20]|nr:hypothetical protein [Pontibacter sp. HSC-14F20]MBX0335229.1 hypothetical protein [Pontibacter sp. HSC-14F20]